MSLSNHLKYWLNKDFRELSEKGLQQGTQQGFASLFGIIASVESGDLTFLSSIARLSFPAALPVDKSAGCCLPSMADEVRGYVRAIRVA